MDTSSNSVLNQELLGKPSITSSPVEMVLPINRQKVSASLEKLLGAGFSPPTRPGAMSRDRSSSREALSSSGDELSPARDTATFVVNDMFHGRNRISGDPQRGSGVEESWNPLDDDQEDKAIGRPKSCDALSAGSFPLSSDSQPKDESATGLDSTEDELDSGIMDDDLPLELRGRRKLSFSDRSSSRSLDDVLDFSCIEVTPSLPTEGSRHRIAVTKQSKLALRRKPTRQPRLPHPDNQPSSPSNHVTALVTDAQRDSLDTSMLKRLSSTTPPISPSMLRRSTPVSPKLVRATPPGSPRASPRPTPPLTRAYLARSADTFTLADSVLATKVPVETVVAEAASPAVVAMVTSPATVAKATSPVAMVTSPAAVAMATSPAAVAMVTSPAAVAMVTSPEAVDTVPISAMSFPPIGEAKIPHTITGTILTPPAEVNMDTPTTGGAIITQSVAITEIASPIALAMVATERPTFVRAAETIAPASVVAMDGATEEFTDTANPDENFSPRTAEALVTMPTPIAGVTTHTAVAVVTPPAAVAVVSPPAVGAAPTPPTGASMSPPAHTSVLPPTPRFRNSLSDKSENAPLVEVSKVNIEAKLPAVVGSTPTRGAGSSIKGAILLPSIGSPPKVGAWKPATHTTPPADPDTNHNVPPLVTASTLTPRQEPLISAEKRSGSHSHETVKDTSPKAHHKSSHPPTPSPTWFDKLRLRKKTASLDVADMDSSNRRDAHHVTELKSDVAVQKPTVVTVDQSEVAVGFSPPWLRETRLRRSGSKNGKEEKSGKEEKPSWMKEVLARRRKTKEKLNFDDTEDFWADPSDLPALSAQHGTPTARARDVTQDRPRDLTQDKPRDLTQDRPRDLTQDKPRDLTQDRPRDPTQDKPRDLTQDRPRDHTQDKPRDVSLDKQRDISQDKVRVFTQDKPRYPSLDKPRDVKQDKQRDFTQDKPRYPSLDKPRDVPQDKTRGVSQDKPRDVSHDKARDVTNVPVIKCVAPLKASSDMLANNNRMEAKNSKNSASMSASTSTSKSYLIRNSEGMSRDTAGVGGTSRDTAGVGESPSRRPCSISDRSSRDENIPPASPATAALEARRGSDSGHSVAAPFPRSQPLPPIRSPVHVETSPDKSELSFTQKDIEPGLPRWKADLANRKSQRNFTTTSTGKDCCSADVPQWKRDLLEKKKAKTNAESEEDSSLDNLPPWKQELVRKKKEKVSKSCGVIDAVQDHSQC